MTIDVREIARRAAGRVFAEQGRVEHAVAHPPRAAIGGIHVTFDVVEAAEVRQTGRELVTAQCLASTSNGGTYCVPDGAAVTPLAEEEAHRRGIRLTRGGDSHRRRIAIGSDHGGFAMKREVLAWVSRLGHQVVDFGTRDENPVDYPDFAHAVAEAVASGQCELGIVIDGAGIGSAMAANKVPGVRAATCCDVAMAKNAREHNFANVLSLGGKLTVTAVAHDIVQAFLSTPTGEDRHRRRVEKISEIERRYSRGLAPRA